MPLYSITRNKADEEAEVQPEIEATGPNELPETQSTAKEELPPQIMEDAAKNTVAEKPALNPAQLISPPEDNKWQKYFLSCLMITLIGFTIFFIVTSYREIQELKVRLDNQSQQNELKVILDAQETLFTERDKQQLVEYTKWKGMVWLEKESLNRRYTHSNTLIISRMWARYTGLLLGLIIAIVGTLFILAKLRESKAEPNSEANLLKASVTSASPGIILVTLSAILLLATIVVTTDVKVTDGNVYLPKIPSTANVNSDDPRSEERNKANQTNSGNTNKPR